MDKKSGNLSMTTFSVTISTKYMQGSWTERSYGACPLAYSMTPWHHEWFLRWAKKVKTCGAWVSQQDPRAEMLHWAREDCCGGMKTFGPSPPVPAEPALFDVTEEKWHHKPFPLAHPSRASAWPSQVVGFSPLAICSTESKTKHETLALHETSESGSGVSKARSRRGAREG